MKRIWKELVLAVVLAWGAPWVLLAAAQTVLPETEPEVTVETALPEQTRPYVEMISVVRGGELLEMPMDDYLTGVLLSEMPKSFHMEAKMAQAVVARTYALRRVNTMDKHPGAVCTESSCCQGYVDAAEFADQGAAVLARQAVEATAGLVLTYDGQLIDATYFSCSGGMTEDALAVWGSDVPYLQSVESPGEEIAAHYEDTAYFTKAQLEQALGITLGGKNWVGMATYTEGGGIASMSIGGKVFRGTELRSLLGLRSTAFTVKVDDGGLTFTTKGYGHRVGMSQYGAQAMALAGSGFDEILAHYYQGTVLTTWTVDDK